LSNNVQPDWHEAGPEAVVAKRCIASSGDNRRNGQADHHRRQTLPDRNPIERTDTHSVMAKGSVSVCGSGTQSSQT
jgi:hypothetical protein